MPAKPSPVRSPAAPVFAEGDLRLLARISHHLAAAEDLRETLSLVLDWLAEERGMQRGVISLLSEEGEQLYASITGHGIDEENAAKMRYRPGEGITGRVFADKKPVFIPDIASERNFLELLNRDSKTVLKSMVEASLAGAQPDDKFQFERNGYFVADRKDHTAARPVFNLAVSLRDSWAK